MAGARFPLRIDSFRAFLFNIRLSCPRHPRGACS
nr:MAG TPA: hypothetical protein [Caudoviricetes sp.]DAV64793.1 MAG TPA: hypothetical protein [Caudoviricetes sp.]